ncbi:hypothetical protein MHLP_01645 [Candidatus Mycoplasma haematolamae str. Purdue]|uniref:Ig-like domain-containing protein n=1 Tax=Mycoplasma haematolamae (strain Purdue) TaxID=1212765 RepID=I7CJ65_MYCHA|nr:hypothetical protein [Candidatus Mycoplasma haematolamae]AFO51909.1 hypothetical protein MHLP_01645 [Candidatus Mycoplasma haematolamae str. Purdue]
MTILAKGFALLVATGIVSAVAVPVAISGGDLGKTFVFKSQDSHEVSLYCPYNEGKHPKPKLDWSSKKITCDYEADRGDIADFYEFGQGGSQKEITCKLTEGKYVCASETNKKFSLKKEREQEKNYLKIEITQ